MFDHAVNNLKFDADIPYLSDNEKTPENWMSWSMVYYQWYFGYKFSTIFSCCRSIRSNPFITIIA